MAKNWKSYSCQLKHGPASVFLDTSLRAAAPDAGRPVLVVVTLRMNAPRPDGLSSDGEALALLDVEDALVQALTDGVGAQMTGRITSAGQREFYFYAPAPHRLAETVHGAVARFPAYHVTVNSRPDPQWQHYFGLVPAERAHRTASGTPVPS